MSGTYDPEQKRLDVTVMRLTADEALSDYGVGSTVRVRVVCVGRELCVVGLLPDIEVEVAAADAVAGKVVDVIVDVLTRRADQMPSGNLRQLRTGAGGGDRPVVRSTDGATCWRVNLQHKTPAARRLHFWRLTDGSVELSSIRAHDNMTP